ncbi:polyhydroxyalkanoic acid system family protein [Massilia sp. DWR3-1-1]|uniref:polyhydroxyalkanoic acid system family protein n=1 Tax=Massilia sp. DWR3-1-1 TaxID=2804559 RepID=UPI003CF77777
MADIHIVQAHALNQEQARLAAQAVTDKLARDFQLVCVWDGDTLRFKRSGVAGELVLTAGRAAVAVRLGFLMGAMAPAIRAKLAASMKKVFAG